MSSIDLATRFKIEMYMLNREKRLRSTDMIPVLNELPTDKRHNFMKVPQYRLLCPIHVDIKKKQVLKKFLLRYTTRPHWSPLNSVKLNVFLSWHWSNKAVNTVEYKLLLPVFQLFCVPAGVFYWRFPVPEVCAGSRRDRVHTQLRLLVLPARIHQGMHTRLMTIGYNA